MDIENQVVNEEVTTPDQSELEQTQAEEVIPEDITETAPLAGDKTPPNALLRAKQEEAEKRRIAEERNRQLEEENQLLRSSLSHESDVFSDEGKVIVDKYVTPLQETVSTLTDQLALKDVYSAYPEISKLSPEFDEFRAEYKGISLDKVAKLFISEKGLAKPARKGLEKSTGGQRVPLTTGMTTEDVANLRKNDFKKYSEMVRLGQIKIES